MMSMETGMNVVVFSTKSYDRKYLDDANGESLHRLNYLDPRLTLETVDLATGFDCVCVFVNDQLNGDVLESLAKHGVKVVALRCAGFNNVDLVRAKSLCIKVVRVPAYSPYSVAEHTVGLILSLNRNLHRAYSRVRDGNFSLAGLLGFDLCGRTVGVIGTGKIGTVFAKIMSGFGCRVLGYDRFPNHEFSEHGREYVELPKLFAESDIISFHCPLTPETRHMVNSDSLAMMKDGVMLINTSRGAVVDTQAVIAGLKSGKIGHLGLDVYEEEADVFFEDLSNQVIPDDTLSRLLTFPNVLITGHQAFFTQDALMQIAKTTLQNITDLESNGACKNEVPVHD
jgi:D-lactate dehydrogenase